MTNPKWKRRKGEDFWRTEFPTEVTVEGLQRLVRKIVNTVNDDMSTFDYIYIYISIASMYLHAFSIFIL